MTENTRDEFENADPPSDPPQTGHPTVDDALSGLAEVASAPLSEHHDRLARVHATLQEALDRPDEDQSHDAEPA
jgi:hypothetical protein